MDLDDLKYLHEKLLSARIDYGHIDLIVQHMLPDNGVILLQGNKLFVSKDYFFRLSTDFENAINEPVDVKEIPIMKLIPTNEFLQMAGAPINKTPFFSKKLTSCEVYPSYF